MDNLTVRLPGWLFMDQADELDRLGRRLEACRQYLLMIANQEMPVELRQKVGASDVVQETFLEAQRDIPEYIGDDEDDLLAWLRRVLLNNIANVRRQYLQTEKRDVAREVSLEAGGCSGARCGVPLPAQDLTPSNDAAHEEESQLLEEALERLPAHLRQVILLRHRENQSFPEIAVLLGRSPAAVRKLWVRAVERLQQELSGKLGVRSFVVPDPADGMKDMDACPALMDEDSNG